jgi:hypothetical protein
LRFYDFFNLFSFKSLPVLHVPSGYYATGTDPTSRERPAMAFSAARRRTASTTDVTQEIRQLFEVAVWAYLTRL